MDVLVKMYLEMFEEFSAACDRGEFVNCVIHPNQFILGHPPGLQDEIKKIIGAAVIFGWHKHRNEWGSYVLTSTGGMCPWK